MGNDFWQGRSLITYTMMGLLEKKKSFRRKSFKFSFNKKSAGIAALVLVVILVVSSLIGYFGIYKPAMNMKVKANEVAAQGKLVNAAFKENDLEKVQKELDVTEVKFNDFKKEAKKLYWIKPIPFLGGYGKDLNNAVDAGGYLISAAKKTITAIEPHADLIGFKKGTDTSFVDKPAELRLQTAVLTLDSIVKDVDAIAEDVDQARIRIDKIDPNRYPEDLNGTKLRDNIEKGISQFDGIASLFVDAKPFLKNLPEFLGAKEEKTYLILFMNDKELRPTGGFLTAYAIFKVNKGKFEVAKSDDIYSLDASISKHPKAPEKILAYHKGVSQFNIRDSNLSPDFHETNKLFDSLYQQSSIKVEYDGIIAMDTYVLIDALKILGDTQARGTNFSADIDKRCDCPQAIYKLLDEIDRPVSYIKTDRKGILGDLLFAIMQKALGFSPSKYWGQLAQEVLMKNLNEKHILMDMKDKEIQESLVALNFAGRIQETEGDYLHINDTNFAGAKSNLFVQHSIKSDTTIAQDGTVTRDITIDYKNPYKHSNCSQEQSEKLGVGGLCINATLRNWLRVYVPEGSKLVSFNGSEKKTLTYDELGKTVFEGFLGVQPEGKATVKISYTLPFKVENKSDYNLLVQKQPGTAGHAFTATLNGKKVVETKLLKDISYSAGK